ncbi:MAG: EamA family transporter RarD [Acidimicrobiia bacterium]
MWFGVAAYTVWGLSPLFWSLGEDIPALDLLLNRILWALPILAVVITVQRHWPRVVAAYRVRNAGWISLLASLFLAANWGVFIWAVTHEQVLAASLGYFIVPLVSVLLGVFVLGEHLRPMQWAAISVGAFGVLVMALRIGDFPWVALSLGFSFGFYGLMKKRPETPRPLDSLFGEVSILAIPALLLLVFVRQPGEISLGTPLSTYTFLALTGVITVVPLLLFGAAAKRIPLSTLGFLQYIAPTLQLIIGSVMLGEALTQERLFGFVIVWIALALFSYDSYRSTKKQSVNRS